jgi:hypothetical protein
MPLDPSIIVQPRRVAQITPQEAQEGALRLSALQNGVNEQQRQSQDRQTIADLYRNNVDPSGNLNAAGITQGLAQAGLGDRIPQFQNSQAEYGKAVAGMNSEQLKFHKQQLDAVNGSLATLLSKPDLSHDDVIGAISGLVDQGVIDSNAGAKMVQQLPGPDQLRPWLTQRALEGLDQSQKIEKVLPKYDEQDRGGVINQGTINNSLAFAHRARMCQRHRRLMRSSRPTRPTFGGRTQELLASMAARGVALPSGLRSQAQMAATLAGLINKYPRQDLR